MQYFEIAIPEPIQARLALETETRELGVSAGLQDRVIQVYEGLVYMDFAEGPMKKQGHGDYERLDPDLLSNVYVAYRTSLSEGTEVFHNDIRARFNHGEPKVVNAMKTWAKIAQQGRQALLEGNRKRLGELINDNFDLRAKIYRISRGNREMIEAARKTGATAKFAGSGGAIVGTYRDRRQFQRLCRAFDKISVAIIEPHIEPYFEQ